MRIEMHYLKTYLLGLAFSSLLTMPVWSQEKFPTYKLVIETVGVGRCLYMEGRFTQDQSSSFVAQYLNKKGVTGTQVKNLSSMKDFEQQVDGFIKSVGGCKHLSDKVLKGTKW